MGGLSFATSDFRRFSRQRGPCCEDLTSFLLLWGGSSLVFSARVTTDDRRLGLWTRLVAVDTARAPGFLALLAGHTGSFPLAQLAILHRRALLRLPTPLSSHDPAASEPSPSRPSGPYDHLRLGCRLRTAFCCPFRREDEWQPPKSAAQIAVDYKFGPGGGLRSSVRQRQHLAVPRSRSPLVVACGPN